MPFMDYNMPPPNYNPQEMNDIYRDPFFNPMMQYEQAFTYYRYLCMQMDYKIKCKEYEELCKNSAKANSSIPSTSPASSPAPTSERSNERR